MSRSKSIKKLLFACECVSGAFNGYSDPWASIAKNKLMPDGTKEEIINLVAEEPKTISQIAERLKLSAPSVHSHISNMIKSEILRESEEWERKYPAERYYEPNFPVVLAKARAEFKTTCVDIAENFAEIFEKNLPELERAFAKTDLPDKGWNFADVVQYFYANAQRGARKMLEERGSLPIRQQHQNGIAWLFWAEESESNEDKIGSSQDE